MLIVEANTIKLLFRLMGPSLKPPSKMEICGDIKQLHHCLECDNRSYHTPIDLLITA